MNVKFYLYSKRNASKCQNGGRPCQDLERIFRQSLGNMRIIEYLFY